ncbi:hypothetical protein BGW41_006937 [Actinomortierella wolfii]|nr:hypothetical protein BGW41_006937 [Actinomortierella wolfii]
MTSYPSYQASPAIYHKPQQQPQSESLLFTPPLSPTEEQLLAFLIPDIDPRELAAYLSNPSSPTVSTDVVSGLLIDTKASSVSSSSDAYLMTPSSDYHASATLGKDVADLVPYPSPVCQAAATVVASSSTTPYTSSRSSFTDMQSRKRCSTYAFDEDEIQNENASTDDHDFDSDSCSFVMSSQNTRKRLLLEQPFFSPDEDLLDEHTALTSNATTTTTITTTTTAIEQDGYAHLFDGAASVADQDVSVVPSMDLSSPIAFDLVLV